MSKFIEVNAFGEKRIINVDWIEEIREEDKGSTIYFAFTLPDGVEQDSVKVADSYESLKNRLGVGV